MSSFGTPYVPPDADSGWTNLEGAMRVRANSGLVQIQVSVDNGDGTFSVSTVNLTGSLRDTRKTTTKWPNFNAQGLPVGVVRTAKDQLAHDQSKIGGKVPVPTGPPVSGKNTGN